MPQIQFLLEICDLEEAHFIQYLPQAVFGEATFLVSSMSRDREWFSRHLPAFKVFINTVRLIQDNPEIQHMLREDPACLNTIRMMLGLEIKPERPLFLADANYVQRLEQED